MSLFSGQLDNKLIKGMDVIPHFHLKQGNFTERKLRRWHQWGNSTNQVQVSTKRGKNAQNRMKTWQLSAGPTRDDFPPTSAKQFIGLHIPNISVKLVCKTGHYV